MKTAATNKRVRELITGLQDGTLVPRPEFQRRLVWSNKDKVNFIDTILSGYPFPEIYMADGEVDLNTGKGTQILVDGQQRVTTLYEYFSGSDDLKLPANVPPYKRLSEEKKSAFLLYEVAVRDLGTLVPAEVVEVFRRINLTSYNLSDMEINNAVYRGPFKVFGEELAELPFFEEHRLFRPMQLRRMGDVKFVLSLVISMMHGYFNRDDEIEEYLGRFNEEFPAEQEMRDRFLAVIEMLERLEFGKEVRIWKQNDLYTVFVELDKALFREKSQIDIAKMRENLRAFYDRVDREQEESGDKGVREYYTSVLQAANDRLNRVKRGEIIQRIISDAVVRKAA